MMAHAQECCSNRQDLTIQRWLGEARRTGRRDCSSAKRPHARFTWRVAVTLEVEHAGQPAQTLRAETHDISPTGLAVQCRQRVETGSVVRVRNAAWGGSVHGIVRFCSASMGEFRVGVEFLSGDQLLASQTLAA